MKRLLKLITAVVLGILVLSLAGCSATESHPEFLTAHEWKHYTYCDETICFGGDGSYTYHCACGNPVEGSDLYDSYEYNKDASEIMLHPENDSNTIRVLRYEKSRLLLGFSDGVKEFFDAEDSLVSNVHPHIDYDSDNYTLGFSSYLTILEKSGNRFTTAPAGYDGDYPEYNEYLIEENLSSHAEFYEWNVIITATDEGEQSDSTYKKLSERQVEEMLDGGPLVGYVWYNDNAEIEKIVFYGSISYYE